MIIGNHDCYYKNTNSVNSPSLLLQTYSNIKTYSSPRTINVGGLDIMMVPWICSENYEETINKIKVPLINNYNCMTYIDLFFPLKLHIYDNSASGVRGLRIATDSSTVGPTIRMDYAPGGLRNWLIGTSYEYSNDFEIRVSNANSGDPGADGSARFILWADGGYSNAARSIGSLSSTSLGVFSSANVQRWTFSSLCNNTYRTLVASVNGIHGILKIAGTDAGNKNYGEYYVTFSFPGYGVMNFVQLHYSGGGWNTGGFELTYSNTGSAYFLQFRNTSYYSTGNTASYTMELTCL
jgi:hypothetical protein